MDTKAQLRTSSLLLNHFKLYQSAKWSSEALCGMCSDSSLMKNSQQQLLFQGSVQTVTLSASEEADTLMFARNLFDCKEFDRVANILQHCTSAGAVFTKYYAMYLSYEKKQEEDTEGSLGANSVAPSAYGHKLAGILKDLSDYLEKYPVYEMNDDETRVAIGLLYYLKALLLNKQQCISEAEDAFIKSLEYYAWNWTCWYELICTFSTYDKAMVIMRQLEEKFENHIMFQFFQVVTLQEFHRYQSETLFNNLTQLLEMFPKFAFLKVQHALVNYHRMDYNKAEQIFDEVLADDPLRIEDMDIYSNILYVMQKKAKLAYLAQFTSSIDKFRAETCCIIANYYSMKLEHEKAIMYFRRALTLNKNCLSAWTLMGHEFVELKNSNAAIESYRRAVDTNPKDFKAWYGLGQAYDVIDMRLYALYYYQRACALKPLDKRMWSAVGMTFERLGKPQDAIKSFKRALQLSENSDVGIMHRLAELYDANNHPEETEKYMLSILKESTTEGPSEESAKARLWLSKYEANRENWKAAYDYAIEMTHGDIHDIEAARLIARTARARMNR